MLLVMIFFRRDGDRLNEPLRILASSGGLLLLIIN
jgi:hypothetical protein